MMGTDRTKGYLLILPIDFVEETLMSERTVIGVIVLDEAIGLRHYLLEGLDRQYSFVHSVVTHRDRKKLNSGVRVRSFSETLELVKFKLDDFLKIKS